MKNILYKVFSIALMGVLFFSCEEEKLIFEGDSRAQFNVNQGLLTINPSENTVNVFSVGVSQASNVDRTFSISVSEESTLDPSYYEIASESGIIKAGEFVGNIEITTFATLNFPAESAQLILTLDEVQDTEFINGGNTTLSLGTLVACEFDADVTVGTYQITADGFGAALGATFEIVAGPGDNQVTMLNPLNHINPETGEGDFEVIIDIDPVTGAATVPEQNECWDPAVFGLSFTDGGVDGDGFVFSCLESIQFQFRYCVNAGCYGGTYAFNATKVQ